MRIITFLAVIFFFQSNAQVTKNDANTENFINGSFAQKTFNYTSGDFASLPSSNVNSVTISVEFTIEDLDLFFEARNEDLAIRLISPTGTIVNLIYDSSGIFTGSNQTATFTGTTLNFSSTTILFDDTASTSVSVNSDPQSGTFRPEEQLGIFQNETAIGTWALEIGDGFANGFGDQITYNSAEINIFPNTSLSLEDETLKDIFYLRSTLIKDDIEIISSNNNIIDKVNIYDQGGRLILQSENQLKINVTELDSGSYFIEIIELENQLRSINRFIKR